MRKRFTLALGLACAVHSLAQTTAPDLGRGIKLAQGTEVILGENPDIPRYHALVIGISDYRHCQDLPQARKDAESLSTLLRDRYGFGARLRTVYDQEATRQGIVDALYGVASDMTASDALLIYYAGHGFYDRSLDNGYWIPCDAREPTRSRPPVGDWVADVTIKDYLAKTKARHVLVLSDACFSGALLRSLPSDLEKRENAWYRMALSQPTRYVITSGDLQQVPDQSVFSLKIIEALQYPRQTVFSATDLANWIRGAVAEQTGCQLRAGPLRTAVGNDAGDFVFLVSADITFIPSGQLPAPQQPEQPSPPILPKASSSYVVQAGDSLAVIAKRYSVSVAQLRDANNLKSDAIRVGQRLQIPAPVVAQATPLTELSGTHPRPRMPLSITTTNYVVQIGDTFSSIAIRADVKLRDLMEINGITSQSRIYVGQKLIIHQRPASQSVPTPSNTTVQHGSTQPGETQTIDLGGGVTLEMVWIPPGIYTMGSPSSERGRDEDETQHRVTLTKGFWMGKYEVTQEQWQRIIGSSPSFLSVLFARHSNPVKEVSWDDCHEFIGKLNSCVSGGGFRMPTEAEWEYACRAGTTTALHNGKELTNTDEWCLNLDAIAWYDADSGWATKPVGQKQANAWGLYDMSGNVWEWCQDWYGGYPTGAVTDPVGAALGSHRVMRGGSWIDSAEDCRSADRSFRLPSVRRNFIGFRIARTLP